MSRTIKRDGPARRPTVRRPPPKKSLGDRMIAKVPVSEATLRKVVTWTILGVAAAAGIATASWFGVPATIGTAVADSSGQLGLRVAQVDITGLKRMNRETVYAVALEDQPNAMLRVDLVQIRERLLAYGWVADAYVSRRLPDRLLIHIVEREPAAIWQNGGNLTLIDATGVPLETVDRDRMPSLPLVIGPGADRQEAAYQRLLSAAPALKPRVKAATWVGNRRWDLTFDTGETLALPQAGASAALVKFAQLDGARSLLGIGWLRFDLRDPAKLVARKPGTDVEQRVPDDGTGGGGGAAVDTTRLARISDA